MKDNQPLHYFGKTYSTDAHNFGETLSVFEVPEDWDGYRYHGYMRADQRDVEELLAFCTEEE